MTTIVYRDGILAVDDLVSKRQKEKLQPSNGLEANCLIYL